MILMRSENSEISHAPFFMSFSLWDWRCCFTLAPRHWYMYSSRHGKYSVREKIEEHEEKRRDIKNDTQKSWSWDNGTFCTGHICMLFLFPLKFHEDNNIKPHDLIWLSPTLLFMSTWLCEPLLSKWPPWHLSVRKHLQKMVCWLNCSKAK